MKSTRATSQFASLLWYQHIVKVIGKYLRSFLRSHTCAVLFKVLFKIICPFVRTNFCTYLTTQEQLNRFLLMSILEKFARKNIEPFGLFFFNRTILTTTSHEDLRAFAFTSGE